MTLSDRGPIVVVGGGLAGCLLAFELEREGIDFVVYDVGAGATSSRVAAGIFNPLTGPRFSHPEGDWEAIGPCYRRIEETLGIELLHWGEIYRPLPVPNPEKKIRRPASPSEGPGWGAHWKMVELPPELSFEGKREGRSSVVVSIWGGGWVDVANLIDAASARFRAQGRWVDRSWDEKDGEGRTVVWCGGIRDFIASQDSADSRGSVWSREPWQAVKGEILTVRIPQWSRFLEPGLPRIWIDRQFLVALDEDGVFRFGATHVWDDATSHPTRAGREALERQLRAVVQAEYEVVDHVAGVRPASKTLQPFVKRHPARFDWFLFNGFSGRGVSRIPIELPRLIRLLKNERRGDERAELG